MRSAPRACALALLLWATVAWYAPAVATGPTFDSRHHFVVVTFANEPYRAGAHAGTTGARYTGDSYTVAQSAHDKALRVAEAYSLRQVASWPIKELSVHCVVYEIPDSRAVADVLRALTGDPRVTLAQPLQEFHTLSQTQPTAPQTQPTAPQTQPTAPQTQPTAPQTQRSAPSQNQPAAPAAYNDPLYGLQTNLLALGIAAAHEHSMGAGVRVGLIDTAVDARHPDLTDRIAKVRSFVDDSPAPAGASRHGTAMAGLIAAVANNRIGIVGIAPQARIEVFEACWQLKPDADDAACNTFTLAKALAAALESHVPLINLSIAGPPDPLLTALVRTGLKQGVIFVGSAGDTAESFPTDIEGVIGVGGDGGKHAGVTLTAPSDHVLTLRPGDQYDFESGTSVAAAEITGVLALLLSSNGHLNRESAVALLRETSATPTEAPSDSAGSKSTVDAGAALARLEADRDNSRLAVAHGSR